MAAGCPPARLVAVRRAPRRLPRARPVRGCARGFCGLRALVGPSAVARPVAVPRSGLRPAPRPVGPWCASPAAPPPPLASACQRLRAPVTRVRAAPRWPGGRRRAPPPPVRPGAGPGPLSAPGSPWFFRLAWPGGSPRAARRLRRRLRPRSSRAGARGFAPFPCPRALPRPASTPPLPGLEFTI